jgi:hypothetical protein
MPRDKEFEKALQEAEPKTRKILDKVREFYPEMPLLYKKPNTNFASKF